MRFTNYYFTWREFRQSKAYKETLSRFTELGIKPKYANNIMRTVFDAGWGKKKIVFVKTENQKP